MVGRWAVDTAYTEPCVLRSVGGKVVQVPQRYPKSSGNEDGLLLIIWV